MTNAPHLYRTVQALRAAAALLVVAFHASEVWCQRLAPPGAQPWGQGSAGVDLFFVISGFVMALSAAPLAARPDGWRVFLRRRCLRILPLYWLLTTLKLGSVAALPSLALHTRPDLWNGIASYLLIPARDAAGEVRPVLPVGWTLSFEALFYALYALALRLRLPPLRVVAPVLLPLAVLGFWRAPDWPAPLRLADGLVLEFVLGLWLGRAVLAGRRVKAGVALALGVSGGAALLFSPSFGPARAVAWGLPALAVLAGAVGLEARIGRHLPRWVLALGDASYAIYLSHGFVLPLVALPLRRLAADGSVPEGMCVALGLALSGAVGWAVHRWVERPLNEIARSRFGVANQNRYVLTKT
jgi:exopolysaccharide production protein ExoZ